MNILLVFNGRLIYQIFVLVQICLSIFNLFTRPTVVYGRTLRQVQIVSTPPMPLDDWLSVSRIDDQSAIYSIGIRTIYSIGLTK